MIFEIGGLILLVFAVTLLVGLASASIWVAINREVNGFESVLNIIFSFLLASILIVMNSYVLEAAEVPTYIVLSVYFIHVMVGTYMLTLRMKSNLIKQIIVVLGVVGYTTTMLIMSYGFVLTIAAIAMIALGIVTGIYRLIQKRQNRHLGRI